MKRDTDGIAAEQPTYEKRSHFRGKARPGRRVDLRYRKLGADVEDSVQAVTRNIGVGGAYILTDAPEAVGALLHIELHVPTDNIPIEVTGEVRWFSNDTPESEGMGVRFLNVDVEALLKLSEYFASLTPTDDVVDTAEGSNS